MKQKVLTYANDGNTVVSKFMELAPVAYHAEIFTTPLEDYGRTNLVFRFKEVFYCEGNYSMQQIDTLNNTLPQ
jgi:hypothetical protein